MSRFDAGGAPGGPAAQMPWDAGAGKEIREVRRAITAHVGQGAIDDDLAPMMAELLRRIDALVEGSRPEPLGPPRPPNPADPPSEHEASKALGGLTAKLREAVDHQPQADPVFRQALAVLEEHQQLRHEVLLRARSTPKAG